MILLLHHRAINKKLTLSNLHFRQDIASYFSGFDPPWNSFKRSQNRIKCCINESITVNHCFENESFEGMIP